MGYDLYPSNSLSSPFSLLGWSIAIPIIYCSLILICLLCISHKIGGIRNFFIYYEKLLKEKYNKK